MPSRTFAPRRQMASRRALRVRALGVAARGGRSIAEQPSERRYSGDLLSLLHVAREQGRRRARAWPGDLGRVASTLVAHSARRISLSGQYTMREEGQAPALAEGNLGGGVAGRRTVSSSRNSLALARPPAARSRSPSWGHGVALDPGGNKRLRAASRRAPDQRRLPVGAAHRAVSASRADRIARHRARPCPFSTAASSGCPPPPTLCRAVGSLADGDRPRDGAVCRREATFSVAEQGCRRRRRFREQCPV